jgi:hypothetical protein
MSDASEYKRAWYQANREATLRRQRDWRAANNEEARFADREYQRAWRAAHREHLRKYNREYMRALRARDPAYRARERAQQRERYHRSKETEQ